MASAEAEIRHVFGATCIGAAPPDIVKLWCKYGLVGVGTDLVGVGRDDNNKIGMFETVLGKFSLT